MTPNEYTFRYRVCNWPTYNRALIARSRLTFWFNEEAVDAWRNTEPQRGRGAPKVYTDTALQCALVLKSMFHLSLRSTQGFMSSLLQLLRLDLPVPDYSTLSRRQDFVVPSVSVSSGVGPRHVVDVTGLKFYDSGEWRLPSSCNRRSFTESAASIFKARFSRSHPIFWSYNELSRC